MNRSMLVLGLCLCSPLLFAADKPRHPHGESSQDLSKQVFATVGKETISVEDYMRAISRGMRQRFYHGKVPQEKLKAFRKETADALVERAMLIQMAKKKGIRVDQAWVDKKLQEFEKRFKDKRDWKKHKAQILQSVRNKLSGDDLVKKLKDRVQTVSTPSKKTIEAFYSKHPEKFTTPNRSRVSVILLKVQPSSPKSAWKAAFEEGERIRAKLKKGASFEKLAKIHSGDASGKKGGDLGFIHEGMLSQQVQKVLAPLKPGELSSVVVLLQGVAIFRLEERIAAKLNPLDKVHQRAVELWTREQKKQAWEKYVNSLKGQFEVSINESYL